ncbi:Centriolar_protein SAS N-terminal domain-containing protein [Hexamita inflata]|uniref:Centriolar protein SAS N-terminal domain-containing protein n=2 Tax=Hexamita inflata TaxID=28002 RepID=A0AA86UIS9_9EUKA|nr:Centriolar protein SAS N-terminal domain-containing protein [Hexamita inflata]CAI9941638.1 Centriolar protein SAS N-terminal domain-containing protein [Hexamita inflata]
MQFKGPFETETSHELFAREITIDLRRDDTPSQEGFQEQIYVKVLQDGDKTIILLSSEHDLFFHYTCVIDESNFNELAQEQNLTVNMLDFGAFIVKLLNSALRDPRSFIILMFLSEDGQANVTFTENFKNYKFLEILTLPLAISTEDVIRCDITSRYLTIKQKNNDLQTQLTQLQNMIKLKLPGLMGKK